MVPKNCYLADTGLFVAFFRENDYYHKWAIDIFRTIEPPFFVCESVISETLFQSNKQNIGKILDLIESGVVEISFDLSKEKDSVFKLMRKYADLPMSLADACLVRMSEMNPYAVIITLDKHFETYRKHRRNKLSVLIPPDLP